MTPNKAKKYEMQTQNKNTAIACHGEMAKSTQSLQV